MSLVPWFAMLLVGCTAGTAPEMEYVAPLDGQSGVALDAPLLVFAPDLTLPPDYAAPAPIRVVDLGTGGFVRGDLIREDAAWWFAPHGGWDADTRYAWVVDPPEAAPHGPQFGTTALIVDSFVFDTSDAVTALAAVHDGTDLCVVFSRPVDASALTEARLTVDDVLVDASFAALDASEWAIDLPLTPEGDPGPDVACATAPEGSTIRLWLGEAGPWLLEPGSDTPAQAVSDLYAWTDTSGGDR